MSVLRTLLILPPVAAGIALVALAAANRPVPAQSAPQERAAAARYITVEAAEFVPRVVGYGTVEPARTWTAVAQVAGRLDRVSPAFVRGAFVDKDAEIARIAPEDFQLAIAQADASIGTLDANIEELKASAEATALSLEIEREALALEVEDLERQRTLLGRGTASAATVDQKHSEVLRQRAKIQDLENSLKLVPAKLRALEQQKAVSEANRRIAELNLERTVVRAPFAGRVAAANVEATQFVGVGSVLGTIDGTEVSEVDVQIPQSEMRDFAGLVARSYGDGTATHLRAEDLGERVRLPATVRLRVGDRNVEWTGRVTRISDTVDPKTRTVGVIVAVDDPYRDVTPGERPPLIKGMFVEVEVRGQPVRGSLVVPRAAVSDGLVHVIGADDRLQTRKVRVAYTFRDAAVIAEGIAAGDRVVVSELAPALPGMRLRPVQDEERAQRLLSLAAGGTGR
ncbi:efflux RND transporter periplasmic adaptor subunit [Azospirillum sp. A39]|uniref:efflux RND transporter periplasmic adaptor subunit n=1 Tax=Azospirillum sp. A39 TaxID=3462279 RepID=UPI0040460F40